MEPSPSYTSSRQLSPKVDKISTLSSLTNKTSSPCALHSAVGTLRAGEVNMERAFSSSSGANTVNSTLVGTATSRLLGLRTPEFKTKSRLKDQSPSPLVHPVASHTESPLMFSKKFWDKGDPELERARAIYFHAYFVGLVAIIITIFVVFSIYWGSLWRVPNHALQGWVVVRLSLVLVVLLRRWWHYGLGQDFDGEDIGQTVTQSLLDSHSRIIRWRAVPTLQFPNGIEDVVSAIVKEESVWVAITSESSDLKFSKRNTEQSLVNSNSTSTLQSALEHPDPLLDTSNSISVYAAEARNENA